MWLSSRLEQEEAGQAGASGTASLAVRVRECLMRADTRVRAWTERKSYSETAPAAS